MKIITKALNVFVILHLVVLVITVFMGVFFRYVINSPLTFSNELPSLNFAYIIFFGIGLAVEENSHMGLDLLSTRIYPHKKSLIRISSHLIILLISIVSLYLGIILTIKTGMKLQTLGISIQWLYAALPLGFFFTIIYAFLIARQYISIKDIK